MSNLSDLLPAGAGAKSATFTASGNLATGETVALKSDGTVEVIAATSASTGSVTNFDSGSSVSQYSQTVVYDVSQNKVLITYSDTGNNGYLSGVVGTVSGTSISFGTVKVIESNDVNQAFCVYCPDISKSVVFYKLSANNYTEAKILTISGTTISNTGSQGLGTTNRAGHCAVFDPDNNKVIFTYRDAGNSNYGTAQVCTVTASNVTAATAVVFASVYAGGRRLPTVYDTLNDKVVVSYFQDTASPRGKSVVGTVSGTSTSWGTPVEFLGSTTNTLDACFDSTANKVVIAYRKDGSGDHGQVIVGTVSGTSISFGSATTFVSSAAHEIKIVYDAGANKSVIVFTDQDANSGVGDGRLIEATVSGTSVTVANDTQIITNRYDDTAGAYDSSAGRVVFAFKDEGDNDNDAVVHQTSSTNSGDFVGITDEAISDTATGSVIVEGGVITNASLGLTLTPGTTYYVQDDGSLGTGSTSVTAGKALAATTLLLKG